MFDLKVGFTCNNNCIHCVVGGKREKAADLTTEEIKAIIDKVPSGEEIQFTGGEPSIRKDLPEILKYSYNTGHQNIVQSNGTGFSSEEFTRECAPYLKLVVLAIHSYDEKIHNKIVNCDGKLSMYKLTMAGFHNLIDYKVPIHTQTVISSLNMSTLYDTYAMVQRMIPRTQMYMTYPHALGNAYKNHDRVCVRYDDLTKYLYPCLRDFGECLHIEALPLCKVGYFIESSQGILSKIYSRQNLNRKGFDASLAADGNGGFVEDYYHNDVLSEKRLLECNNCCYSNKCDGVWKEYLEFFPDNHGLTPVNNRALNTPSLYHVILQGKVDKIPLDAGSVNSTVIIKGDILKNKETILREMPKFHNWLIDISACSQCDISEFKDVYINITKHSDISKLLSVEEHNWHIDVDITSMEESKFTDLLNTISRLQGLKFVKVYFNFGVCPAYFRQARMMFSQYGFPIGIINTPLCETGYVSKFYCTNINIITANEDDVSIDVKPFMFEKNADCQYCEMKDFCFGHCKTKY